MSSPLDAEVAAAIRDRPLPESVSLEMLPEMRELGAQLETVEGLLSLFPSLIHQEHVIHRDDGTIALSILQQRPRGAAGRRPCVFFIHGGGMILGHRLSGAAVPAEWIAKLGVVCVFVEYRLAPEHQAPIPVEDCFSGLQWVDDNCDALEIDPHRLILAGHSAGGALAAGVALMARDRGGPEIAAQMLLCPMLDDRNTTVSSHQFANQPPWTRASNLFGWKCLLGNLDETEYKYSVPARAAQLGGLPPTYIDVGSADILRDEVAAYGSRLLEAGVPTELHVWQGGIHGFELLAPRASLSIITAVARMNWITRALSLETKEKI